MTPEILWHDTTVLNGKEMASTDLAQHDMIDGEMFFSLTQVDFDGEIDVVLLTRKQIESLSAFARGH